MSSYFFDRRRSEHFAELLDDPDRLRRHRRLSRSEAEMDWGVRMVRRVEHLQKRFSAGSAAPGEFRDAFRGMLVAAAKRQGDTSCSVGSEPVSSPNDNTVPLGSLAGRPRPVYSPARSHRASTRSPAPGTARTRAAVLVGVTAGALALSGVSAASTDSVPGDALYQVKRSSERAQLALAASDQSRGQLYLEFARSRVVEARQVGTGLAPDVLEDMDRETVAGMNLLANAAVQRDDANLLAPILAFVTEQRTRLADLHKLVAAHASDGVDQLRASSRLLDAIEARARALTRALVQGCAIPTVDGLGPKPTLC